MTQSTIRRVQAFGVPGDVYTSSPNRVDPYILDSDTDENIVGRAFTVASEGHATIGGDAGTFAGILCNSKAYTALGTSNEGTLEPTLQVKKESIGELMVMGDIVVSLKTTTNDIGNIVYYDDATGELGSHADTVPVDHTLVPNAVVHRFDESVAGLAVIRLTN